MTPFQRQRALLRRLAPLAPFGPLALTAVFGLLSAPGLSAQTQTVSQAISAADPNTPVAGIASAPAILSSPASSPATSMRACAAPSASSPGPDPSLFF